jgi:putative endonuclease
MLFSGLIKKTAAMKYHVYILYSDRLDKYYTGCTSDVTGRLRRHNANHKGFTGKTDDWRLIYQEEFAGKSDALAREKPKVNPSYPFINPRDAVSFIISYICSV